MSTKHELLLVLLKLRTFEKKYGGQLVDQFIIMKKKHGEEEMEMVPVVSFIRGQGIQWLGHVWWRNEDNISKVVLEWKPTGKGPAGDHEKDG